jgi:cytidylate kinase
MGKISTLKYVLQDMLARDKADTERAISPMVKAHDAFELDTSDIPLKECVDILLREFNKRRK